MLKRLDERMGALKSLNFMCNPRSIEHADAPIGKAVENARMSGPRKLDVAFACWLARRAALPDCVIGAGHESNLSLLCGATFSYKDTLRFGAGDFHHSNVLRGQR